MSILLLHFPKYFRYSLFALLYISDIINIYSGTKKYLCLGPKLSGDHLPLSTIFL